MYDEYIKVLYSKLVFVLILLLIYVLRVIRVRLGYFN